MEGKTECSKLSSDHTYPPFLLMRNLGHSPHLAAHSSLQRALCPPPHTNLCDVCSIQKDIPLHFPVGTGQLWGDEQSKAGYPV